MPSCSHCGKVNKDGSLFCQECGQRMEVSAPRAAEPSQLTCKACGTTNPAGMNFCKNCGNSLSGGAPPASASLPAAAPVAPQANVPSQPIRVTPSGAQAVAK